MIRIAFFIVTLLVAGQVRAADVWRPEPIFTDGLCNKELAQARADFDAALKTAKIARPRPGETDPARVEPYVRALREADDRTAGRAAAQAAAAGEWRGETRYVTETWNHRSFRIGSCQIAKIKIPLNRALAVARSGQAQTATDIAIVEKVRKLIEIKKAREACRALPSYHANVECRKRLHAYKWLDRYPMD